MENLLVSIEDLLHNKELLTKAKSYCAPWKLKEGYQGSVLTKVAIDAGGGSTKGIQSVVNVENPQIQKYVKTFLEFGGGVKDGDYNIRKAGLGEGSAIHNDLKSMFTRRCSSL